jgi:hypothetical protein
LSKCKNISYILSRNIEAYAKAGRGQSKRADRKTHKGKTINVHSDQTRQTYISECRKYGKWVQSHHPEAYRDAENAKNYVPEYLRSISNNSSRATAAAGIAKGYGLSDGGKSWGVPLGGRNGTTISRGRTLTARAVAWRTNHAGAAEALRSCGLRAGKPASRAADSTAHEMWALRSEDIHQATDGTWRCHVKGKGGLWRDSIIIPGDGLRWMLNRKAETASNNGYIFRGVPGIGNSAINIHAFRAEYAVKCYEYYQNQGDYATGEMYCPRDGSETSWDKGILTAVNEQLGHGDNRAYTAYYNYLSYGK